MMMAVQLTVELRTLWYKIGLNRQDGSGVGLEGGRDHLIGG